MGEYLQDHTLANLIRLVKPKLCANGETSAYEFSIEKTQFNVCRAAGRQRLHTTLSQEERAVEPLSVACAPSNRTPELHRNDRGASPPRPRWQEGDMRERVSRQMRLVTPVPHRDITCGEDSWPSRSVGTTTVGFPRSTVLCMTGEILELGIEVDTIAQGRRGDQPRSGSPIAWRSTPVRFSNSINPRVETFWSGAGFSRTPPITFPAVNRGLPARVLQFGSPGETVGPAIGHVTSTRPISRSSMPPCSRRSTTRPRHPRRARGSRSLAPVRGSGWLRALC